MWLLLLAGAGLAVFAARSAAPATSTTATAPKLPLIRLTKRVSGGPVPLTPGQQAAVAACNQLSGATRTACLSLADPNFYCAQAFTTSERQAKCLDYAADPCGQLLEDATAQALCRQGVQAFLSGDFNVEDLIVLNASAGGAAGCTAAGFPEMAPLCAKLAESISRALINFGESDPPEPALKALWLLQLSRGTYKWSAANQLRYSEIDPQVLSWRNPTTIERVRHNLKALGLNKIWELPGGAAQARDTVRIVLTATGQLHRPPGWWTVKRFP